MHRHETLRRIDEKVREELENGFLEVGSPSAHRIQALLDLRVQLEEENKAEPPWLQTWQYLRENSQAALVALLEYTYLGAPARAIKKLRERTEWEVLTRLFYGRKP